MYQKHQNFFQQQDNSTSLGFIRPNQQNLIIGPDALQNDYPIQQQLVGLLIRARRTKLGQCSLSLLCSQQAIAQERNLPCGAHLKGSVYRSLVIKKKRILNTHSSLNPRPQNFRNFPIFSQQQTRACHTGLAQCSHIGAEFYPVRIPKESSCRFPHHQKKNTQYTQQLKSSS